MQEVVSPPRPSVSSRLLCPPVCLEVHRLHYLFGQTSADMRDFLRAVRFSFRSLTSSFGRNCARASVEETKRGNLPLFFFFILIFFPTPNPPKQRRDRVRSRGQPVVRSVFRRRTEHLRAGSLRLHALGEEPELSRVFPADIYNGTRSVCAACTRSHCCVGAASRTGWKWVHSGNEAGRVRAVCSGLLVFPLACTGADGSSRCGADSELSTKTSPAEATVVRVMYAESLLHHSGGSVILVKSLRVKGETSPSPHSFNTDLILRTWIRLSLPGAQDL